MKTLLDLNVKSLLKGLEDAYGIKLPEEVVEISLVRNVLHVRFSYPKGAEVEVEPLQLKTPVFLFRDCETGEVTAIEVLDVDELMKEMSLYT
ncbi:MAG: hypothetical protein MRT15_02620 [archaeon YNP-LCB-003-016]|uniref:hypothetical protein n=1 Tax=Candidatus Culexarchaeum yellowstonense TaxID=2928963 RepID=UPI0026F1DE24|nr:hypothetical protein [Candidatus Culexarchaeum yellowstonense]MCR6691261.1 hypothetical protein [Candidatus Culexarchaeum yellowstonense]